MDDSAYEIDLLIRSLAQTVTPTLISEDLALFQGLVQDIFHTSAISNINTDDVLQAAVEICKRKYLVPSEKFLEVCLGYFGRRLSNLFYAQSSRTMIPISNSNIYF